MLKPKETLFHSPESLFLELKDLSVQNIFFITGKNSFKYSGADIIIKEAEKYFKTQHFNDVDVNPTLESALNAIDAFKNEKYDVIFAIGGGSVMDTAKLIKGLASNPTDASLCIKGEKKFTPLNIPLIVAPTTAGSGSETTQFAVVYINKIKYSLDHEALIPDKVLNQVGLTHSCPPSLTAISGIDALCQGIESLWAVSANDESRYYATESIELSLKNLKATVSYPSPATRNNMEQAAFLAGKAINISKTTAPHALAYYLTMNYGIPHGHAVALTLGKFIELNAQYQKYPIQPSISRETLNSSFTTLYRLFDQPDAQSCASAFYELMKNIRLKTRLSELNITSEKQIKSIVENVNEDRLSNNPVQLTKPMIKSLLQELI